MLAVVLLTVSTVQGQYVPPVPQGLRGETRVADRDIPLPDANQKWIRTTSPNFTIISSAPEARTREIAELLETVAGALRRVHPRFDARFGETTVFLFSRRRDSQPFFELLLNQKRTSAPGAFIVQSDGTAGMIVDAGRPLATNRTVKHELMHNILATSGTRLPLWLEEGIAEYFSTTIIRGDTVIVGRPIGSHALLLRTRGILPMEEVIAARPDSPIVGHVLFYPQAWAIVDWMMRSNRKAFYPFVADVENGMRVEEAFRRHYSMEITTAARALRTPAARPSASSMTQIERTPVAVSTTSISRADALYELGMFLGRLVSTRDDAERYLRAALEIEPRHALATAGLGTLQAYSRRYAEATPFFEQALAIDPSDSTVLTAFASALLQNAIGPFAGTVELDPHAPARFRRARALMQTALENDPSPPAQAIAGTTYLVEEDVAPGIALLEKAHAARPARLDFALNLYALLLRGGRDDDAQALFDSVFARARNPQAAFAARAVYVREHLVKANRLIDEQRLEEAAGVVRAVIDVTPDPVAKADLHLQLASLTRIVDSNRQVASYNQAVEAFNRNEHAAVIDMLDRLLADATNDAIRQKAELLRNRARKRLGM